ncbi:hypothetical protein GCM10023213_25160 [Prosthecobacter algae]|uniref:Bro-N domain-containing protein n=1 Tax=Prosthecobacter algae TaxID=1144682 RepID=A0ABP9P6R5_9BACT
MSLEIFDFNSAPIRVMMRGQEPWFVAVDVCRALEIQNPSDAVKALDEDEKATLDNPEGRPGSPGAKVFNIISESGLYALIFKSRKPEAKVFRKWVTSEVLPAIRQTGSFVVDGGGEGESVTLLSFVRDHCAGWSLEKKIELGQLARRYCKAMGVVTSTVERPGLGRLFAFPRLLLLDVLQSCKPVASVLDLDEAEFQRLLEEGFRAYGLKPMPAETLRELAKSLNLFPRMLASGQSLPSERSAFGRLCCRFEGRTFPGGYVLHLRRRSRNAACEIRREDPELSLRA